MEKRHEKTLSYVYNTKIYELKSLLAYNINFYGNDTFHVRVFVCLEILLLFVCKH